MSEIELQLRLDEVGRTAFDPSTLPEKNTQSIEKKRKTHHDCDGSMAVQRGNEESCHVQPTIDYSSKTISTALSDKGEYSKLGASPSDLEDEQKRKCEKDKFMDELLFDCEIADCALMPRTFWLPAKGTKPRCALEQCALEVFHHHVKPGFVYDEERSGCEWWVQIRPSPPAGRYSMLCTHDTTPSNHLTAADKKHKPVVEGATSTTKTTDTKENHTPTNDEQTAKLADLERKGICFHWDKDEELRLLMGGKMYIHPHISTVSYLTFCGAPTMALNFRINPLTGEFISPPTQDIVESFISWPKLGKHLSFDGRYLHAAPYDLMEDEAFNTQCDATEDLDGIVDGKERSRLLRRHRRVTFLVNIWLNYKPLNVNLFPDTMLDKLSNPVDTHILFQNKIDKKSNNTEGENYNVKDYSYDGGKAKTASKSDGSDDLINFQWSLGDGVSERLEMQVPINCVQKQMVSGGDIRLKYGCDSDMERAIHLVNKPMNAIDSSE